MTPNAISDGSVYSSKKKKCSYGFALYCFKDFLKSSRKGIFFLGKEF